MTDLMLVSCGAVVSFVFSVGCYVYIRQSLAALGDGESDRRIAREAELRLLKTADDLPA